MDGRTAHGIGRRRTSFVPGPQGAAGHLRRPIHAQPAAAQARGRCPGRASGGNRLGAHESGGALVRSRTPIRTDALSMESKSVSDLCLEKHLDAKMLAEKAGLDESRVTAIVLGRWTPSPAERDKVAAVFGRTREQISWGHKTPIQHIYGHGPA